MLVLIKHLPRESALSAALAEGPSWSLTDFLLDDIRAALTDGKPHPARPTAAKKQLDPKRIAAAQKRRAERIRAVEAGEIT